jgi:hypothetical protein
MFKSLLLKLLTAYWSKYLVSGVDEPGKVISIIDGLFSIKAQLEVSVTVK